MKTIISGNSIPLNIYPKEKGAMTFGQVLEKMHSWHTIHSCATSKTIKQGCLNVERDVICYWPDLTILCYGIVECFPSLFRKSRMSKESFYYYYTETIKSIRLLTNSKIMIFGILPVSSYWKTKRMVSNIYSFNKILNEIAKEYDCLWVDVSDLEESVKPQGFHLNPLGHEIVAHKIIEAL